MRRSDHQNLSIHSREWGNQFGLREQETSSVFFKTGQSVPHCKHRHFYTWTKLILAGIILMGDWRNTVLPHYGVWTRKKKLSAATGVIISIGTKMNMKNKQPHLEESAVLVQLWPSHLKRGGIRLRIMYVKTTVNNRERRVIRGEWVKYRRGSWLWACHVRRIKIE